VAAALDLGAGARGEDAQHGDRLLARVERAGGHHPEVAEPAAVGAAHDDREVAVEPVLADEAVARERLARAGGDRDHVAVGGQLARRVGEREALALGQLDPAAAVCGEHARLLPGAFLDLGRERDLGVERLGDVAHERAQEGGADGRGGAGRDRAQQIGAGGAGGDGGERRHGGETRHRRAGGSDAGRSSPAELVEHVLDVDPADAGDLGRRRGAAEPAAQDRRGAREHEGRRGLAGGLVVAQVARHLADRGADERVAGRDVQRTRVRSLLQHGPTSGCGTTGVAGRGWAGAKYCYPSTSSTTPMIGLLVSLA
jgi:hypothetical protein